MLGGDAKPTTTEAPVNPQAPPTRQENPGTKTEDIKQAIKRCLPQEAQARNGRDTVMDSSETPQHDVQAPMHEEVLQEAGGTTYERVVAVAVDGSDNSGYALEWALKNIVKPATDKVLLLHSREIVHNEAEQNTKKEHSQNMLAQLFHHAGTCARASTRKQLLSVRWPNWLAEAPHETGATTKLHLDVADAANVMVWSQPHGDETKADESTPHPPYRTDGAIWDLFPPASLAVLRDYLRTSYRPPPWKIDDPVNDQTFYLHPHHLAELHAATGIKPIRLHQMPGDTVFIPVGFAHQVANYGDCIKFALDFVSGESLKICEELCMDFRKLHKGHGRRGDTLCVDKILWGVVRRAMAEADALELD
ncbi:hypothetical protein HKX48_008647 [Thoreauomyces humboldtii]|nr:hypothetical protein HKX48_008647 [Thoreauomyces humboldtii]